MACLLLCVACSERNVPDGPASDARRALNQADGSNEAEGSAGTDDADANGSIDDPGGTAEEVERETTFDSGHEPSGPAAGDDRRAQDSPVATVESYLAAMAVHDASPDLDLYTPATREMLARHAVTRAQMDALVRTYQRCPAVQVSEQGSHAVVDHPGGEAGCAPWFLERDASGLWRLDLVPMQRAIRFDTGNRWRIADPEALGHYRFAFPAE